MAYNGKTNWQLNEIVKPEDMNRIEQGVIDAHENLLTHKTDTNSHTDIRNKFNEFVKGVTGSNATLTITKGNGTTSMVTVNNVANATNATNATNAAKATQDSAGQQINSTYIKGLSVSGKTITYTKGNGTTGTITTQDTVYTHPNSGVTAGTYKSVTVNAQGHVTAGSNPTTLAGYGITDAALKNHTHDDRYYTESEIDSKLSTKSPLIGSTSLSKLSSNVTFGGGGAFSITQNDGSWWQRLRTADTQDKTQKRLIYEESRGTSGSSYTELFSVDGNGNAYAGGTLLSKNGHTHDDRYYTESEINTKLAGKSDKNHTHSNYAVQGSPNNLIDSGNEFTFVPSGYEGDIYFNYKTAGGKNGNIKGYIFGNGKGGTLGTAIHSGNIGSQSVKYATSAATATKATQDSAGQQINTTYIKGLSISGNTITYTKGNGGTGSITVPTGAGTQSYIVESKYNADGSWYRKWSDGWLEQGGIIKISNQSTITVTLLKAFANTKYGVTFGGFTNDAWSPADNKMPLIQDSSKLSTSFSFFNTGEYKTGWAWYACGKGV